MSKKHPVGAPYTIMYNAATVHLEGVGVCRMVTRGNLAVGRSFDSLAEASRELDRKSFVTGRGVCKMCLSGIEAQSAPTVEPIKVTAEFASHGRYQTSAATIDTLYAEHAADSIKDLHAEIHELSGDRNYDTSDLTTRFECFMVLAELRGFATN